MRSASAVLFVMLAATSFAARASDLVVDVRGVAARPLVEPASEEQRALQKQARDLYQQRCALCHGGAGKGDGVMSGSLKPAPRAFDAPAWQRSIEDAALRKVILEGGAAVGRSALMPASPDLAKRPAVLGELVALLRGFERRGVVRTEAAIDEDGAAVVKASGAPEASGQRAELRLEGLAPGRWRVRGYFDVDEDGARDEGEHGFERTLEVGEGEARLEVELGDASPSR